MYFIAVLCPEELNQKLLQYKLWMKQQFGCVVAMKSPAHITIIPPFWMCDKNANELLQTFLSFYSDVNEIEITLKGFSHFGKRVLYVNVVKNTLLEELQLQAEDYFVRSVTNQIKKDVRPFHPHVTIATRDIVPSSFFCAWDIFSIKQFEESFLTQKISLLKLSQGKWNVIAEQNWSDYKD